MPYPTRCIVLQELHGSPDSLVRAPHQFVCAFGLFSRPENTIAAHGYASRYNIKDVNAVE